MIKRIFSLYYNKLHLHYDKLIKQIPSYKTKNMIEIPGGRIQKLTTSCRIEMTRAFTRNLKTINFPFLWSSLFYYHKVIVSSFIYWVFNHGCFVFNHKILCISILLKSFLNKIIFIVHPKHNL